MSVLTELVAALPNPEPAPIPGFDGVTLILGWAKWGGLIIGILALIVLGALLMFNSRRGEGGEHLTRLVAILAGVLLMGSAGFIIGTVSGA